MFLQRIHRGSANSYSLWIDRKRTAKTGLLGGGFRVIWHGEVYGIKHTDGFVSGLHSFGQQGLKIEDLLPIMHRGFLL